jgi:hypothetical protein
MYNHTGRLITRRREEEGVDAECEEARWFLRDES